MVRTSPYLLPSRFVLCWLANPTKSAEDWKVLDEKEKEVCCELLSYPHTLFVLSNPWLQKYKAAAAEDKERFRKEMEAFTETQAVVEKAVKGKKGRQGGKG